jgi:hypothetical protein
VFTCHLRQRFGRHRIHFVVCLRIVLRRGIVGESAYVDDRIHAIEGAGRTRPHVLHYQVHAIPDIAQSLLPVIQPIQDAHRIAALQKFMGKHRAYVASPTNQENLAHSALSAFH